MYQTFLKPFLQDVKKFALDTFFPVRCLACGQEGEFVCGKCSAVLTRLEKQHCIVCEKPSVGGVTHPYCRTPFGADGLISVFDYHDDRVADAIIKGKYSFVPGIYRVLGSLIAKEIKTSYQLLTTGYYLVPIPLSFWRRRWRGFNQAEILCETISKELGLPIADILKRHKLTKVQKDLKKKEQRAKNMSGAFTYSPPKIGGVPEGQGGIKNLFDIQGQNFILVDDVVTTGSTLLEAVKVLKRNGAAKVWCLTVARD